VRSSIRTRLLAAFLTVALVAAAGLSVYSLKELEGFALRKLEERLSAEAILVSQITAQSPMNSEGGLSADTVAALNKALSTAAPDIVSRIRILDSGGNALIDSSGPDGVGIGYARLSEIRDALNGGYGASTRTTADGHVGLYIAQPIWHNDQVIGASYVSATTFSIMTLLKEYQSRLMVVIGLFALVTLVMAETLTRWVSQPLSELSKGASAFAGGDHTVRVTPIGASETRAVAVAFNAMADEVEQMVSELRTEEHRKSRFVSDVSHELRTPLTAIRGAAETLLEGDVPTDDANRFLETIVRESNRLARLANDLLTLERIEGATGELPLRRVRLRVVAERAAAGLEALTDDRNMAVSVEGDAPTVLGDSDRLQQVVSNLVDNASRATPPGGHVMIRLSTRAGFAVLSVLDDGPGIPPDALPHLFDRFYRAQASRDRSSGGAGLGLAIVQAIVQAHAGSITAANRPGGGSVFTIELPALGD